MNAVGEAIGSIGATRLSTNMGQTELFLSGGSEIKFHQSSHNQKLIQTPDLQIDSQLDNSFMLHLEDTDNQERDYDDLSLKITTSLQAKNVNACKLASEHLAHRIWDCPNNYHTCHRGLECTARIFYT